MPAYVGLGSNLDGPEAQVERALAALTGLPRTRCVARSALFRSKPLGPVAQPDFVNAVAGLLTQLGPDVLLAELKALEDRLGRERPVVRWGPRRIDLDLLVYSDARIDDADLTVPHPGIAERAFVLVPLAELAPDLEVAGAGRVRALLDRLGTTGLERIAA
jgi:2-amino-4-hydroxy-6-hydroxymethyldihydropteridine diphosphokinase